MCFSGAPVTISDSLIVPELGEFKTGLAVSQQIRLKLWIGYTKNIQSTCNGVCIGKCNIKIAWWALGFAYHVVSFQGMSGFWLVWHVRNGAFSEPFLVCKLVLCSFLHLWAFLQCPNIDQNQSLFIYLFVWEIPVSYLRPCLTSKIFLDVQCFAIFLAFFFSPQC